MAMNANEVTIQKKMSARLKHLDSLYRNTQSKVDHAYQQYLSLRSIPSDKEKRRTMYYNDLAGLLYVLVRTKRHIAARQKTTIQVLLGTSFDFQYLKIFTVCKPIEI
jgi:hypothetical protein